jgi:hypothetical protein
MTYKPYTPVTDEVDYDGYQDQGSLDAPIQQTPVHKTAPQEEQN